MPIGDTSEREFPLIIFDTDCILCNKYAGWVAKRDGGLFQFAGPNEAHTKEWLAENDLDSDSSIIVREDAHTIHLRSDGIIYILQNLNAPYPRLAKFLRLFPKKILDSSYRLMAKNRKRLQNKDSCPIPSNELKARIQKNAPLD